MKAIFALLMLVIAIVCAQDYGHHKHLEEYVDYQAHPHYNYHYGVHDPKHHDVHDQWEARDGHKTHGSYSLQQPDGRKRIVEYEADKDGIHYNVKYEGHAIHEEGHKHESGGHGHGESHSSQYHHGKTNYAGEVHGHGNEGGGSSGGGGGGEGGHHGQAVSYQSHVQHHH